MHFQNGTELIPIVLQYTIDENHPVKVNGLKDIVQSYSQDIRYLFEKLSIKKKTTTATIKTIQL